MYDNFLSMLHGLVMESSENTSCYELNCARLLTENSVGNGPKELIPVMGNVNEKYLKKINDAFSVLENIAVDSDKMAEFFQKIQYTAILPDIPLGTPIKNINDIGRIKPDYLTQFVKDAANTIGDIINRKVNMQGLMKYFSSDISTKIKKQLVVSNKVMDINTYFKNQEKPIIVPFDSQAIMTLCIPFLRTFPNKKRELSDEIASVKLAITSASSTMNSYNDTLISLKNKGTVDDSKVGDLNYYLFNLNRIVNDAMTYMVFNLITKIEAYTFNVNSYIELYNKVCRYKPEGEKIYHESVFEYSLAATDLDSTVNNIIHGNASALIDWSRRCYDEARSKYENSRTSSKGSIEFILDQYGDEGPYEDLIAIFNKIESSVENAIKAMHDPFAAPASIAQNTGLDQPLSARFSKNISDISNISVYTNKLNNGADKSSVLFSILAEMRESEKNMEDIGNEIKEVYKELFDSIEYLKINEDHEIPNDAARLEMISILKNIEMDFRNFVGMIVSGLIEREDALVEQSNSIVDNMEDVIDVVDQQSDDVTNYNILAVESCIDIDNTFARILMEAEMIRFREAKFAKEYGVMLEAETPAGDNSSDDKDEKATPEVKEDPSKQSDADVKQNADAANDGKSNESNNDPEKKQKLSDKIKELINKITGFFDKLIPDFIKSITSKLPTNKKFIEDYKDAILNRSYNGITLKIYNYFNISSDTIISDISKVSATVSQISDSDLTEFVDASKVAAKLFGFLKVPADTTLDDYLRLYYKVGPNQKEIEKISLSNSQLKTRVVEMMDFCEDYNVKNGYNKVSSDIESLKNAANTKINSLKSKELSSEQIKGLNNVLREVMVFSGAVLTGFRNRNQHYMFALRHLVPKNATVSTDSAATDANQNKENDATSEGQNNPTE